MPVSAATDNQAEIPAIKPPPEKRGGLGPIVYLLVACFVLVATPLLVATISAALSVSELSELAAEELGSSNSVAAGARDIDRDIRELQRHNLQMEQVPEDDAEGYESLLVAVARRQQTMSDGIHDLLLESIDETAREQLTSILELSAAVVTRFAEGPRVDPERLAVIDQMRSLAEALVRYPQERQEVAEAAVREQAKQAQQLLTRMLIVAIPTAFFLIILFTFLITQSLREISSAIKQLGDNEYDDRIRVRGPADLRALGVQLDVLRERLAEAERQKQRFLRHMSHELKTPLASLLEGTELFVDGSLGHLPSAQSEVAGILRSNAQELRHLIENLLDYSAWQSHGSTLRCTAFDLQVLCAQVLDQYRLMMRTRLVTVDQRVVPVDLMADRDKLRTVLSNLLSNAIKYTPENGTIYVRAYRAGGHLLLDIADSGPNILPSERAHVFEPFYTGTPPQQAHLKGSGIGLSLVREYVRAHGGEVNLVDGIYSGAHFRIRMPVTAQSGPVRLSA